MRACMVVACALWAFTAFGVRSHARAQDEAEPPAAYKELVDRALAESAAGRWPEARALFLQAHGVFPNARTLRGIGMVAFEVRDYPDAVRHLRLALLEARRSLDATQRKQTEELLERALSFVARYSLLHLPPATQLALDGRPVQPEADGELLVALGEHRIEARAGERAGVSTINVRGGEREPLPITFAPANAPEATASATPTSAAPDAEAAASDPVTYVAPDPNPPRKPFPVLSTALSVAGGALLIAGAVALIVGLGDVSAVEDAPAGTQWSSVSAREARAPLLTGAGAALLVVGGALGTIGVVGLVSDDAEPAPDGMAISVRGRL